MAMNIKSDVAHELARELAARTGETITSAVIVALRERLERVRSDPDEVRSRAEALLAIGRDTAPRLREPGRSAEHGELLYDTSGLPR